MTDIFGNEIDETEVVKKIKKIKTIATPINENSNIPKIKKIKKIAEVKDIGEKISFCKVSELNKDDYGDFTREKFPRGAIFFDWEVFPFDNCVTFYDVVGLKKIVIVNDRSALVKFYSSHKGQLYFGYNNRNYDNSIYKGIFLGMNPKEINDKIVYEGLKGFQISDKFKDVELFAFDCYRLGHSLKQFESFLQMNIEETSVDFNLNRHLNEKEWEQTLFYNDHDVKSTIEVFRRSPETYNAHMGLLDMFDYLPFSEINKTSAQIVADILKCKKVSVEERDKDQWDIVLPPNLEVKKYRHIIDWFLNPENHNLDAKAEFDIMGLKHKIGYGGIHSAIPKIRIDGGNIWHIDVQSYYPSELIYTKVYPENKTLGELAFGKEGINIYKEIYEKRLWMKHNGMKKEQAPLKIVLNGTYGILRDKNSSAYFPRIATLISVFGQMYLVDLMEHLEDSECEFEIIQNNTDGSIIKCKSEKDVKIMNDVCDEWEKRTLMNLEREEISYIQQKDVNNYLFQFTNGKIEVKGSYVKKTNDLDNDLPIVNECIREYIMNKINVEKYVNDCDDLWKFMKTFKLSGNYECVYHNGIKMNNKCFRVFASKNNNDTYLGKRKSGNETIEKFAGQSDHIFIENGDIHNKKCSEYPQLDKDWYVDLIYKRLEDFGINAKPDIFDMF